MPSKLSFFRNCSRWETFSGWETEELYPSFSACRVAPDPYRRLPWRFSDSNDLLTVASYPPVNYGYPHEADMPLYRPGHIRGFFWLDEECEGEDPNLAF